MNWLVFHIASGHAFFTGVALLVLSALASTWSRHIGTRIAGLSFPMGVIAIAISSTAIPYGYYAIAAVPTVAWVASAYKKPWRSWAPYAFAAAWLIAAMMELPYHITPSLRPALTRNVTVIGDSVTAGVGGANAFETWPNIIARQHDLQVQDISHVGETAASALERAKANEISSPIVVIEIGGNDLLGSTPSQKFAHDLDALLAYVSAPDRQVIMFELPLPPFRHEYGRIQRSLAAKYRVKLVPKRVFLSIIASGDSTLDTIHLSQTGHQRMADCVWSLLQSAYTVTRR